MLLDKHDFEDGNVRVAGAGTTALGIIGTALGGVALANQYGYGNGFLGNTGTGGTVATRYDLHQNERIGALESVIGKLEAEKYSDASILDLYRYVVNANKEQNANVNALFNETFKEIGDLNVETKVNKMEIDKNFQLLNQKVDYENKLTHGSIDALKAYIDCNFVPTIKKISICDICPTPQVAKAVQPTPVCGCRTEE